MIDSSHDAPMADPAFDLSFEDDEHTQEVQEELILELLKNGEKKKVLEIIHETNKQL